MKVAFVGKGGSGKTTVTSLFARYLQQTGVPVLAVDADINQHLFESLNIEGLKRPERKLGHDKELLAGLLAAENTRVDAMSLKPSTPPGTGSHFVTINSEDPVLSRFCTSSGSLLLAEVGEFDKEDTTQHCYHFRQKGAEMLLNHIVSSRRYCTVFDMTAGADSFASGLFGKFDVTIIVVEPTVKSMAVFKQYSRYAHDHDLDIKVIGNKIEDESDVSYVTGLVGKENYLGSLYKSRYIKELERGEKPAWSHLEADNVTTLQTIKKYIDSIFIDYDDIQKRYEKIHLLASKGSSDEKRLLAQIDPLFSLKRTAAEIIN